MVLKVAEYVYNLLVNIYVIWWWKSYVIFGSVIYIVINGLCNLGFVFGVFKAIVFCPKWL